MRAEDQHTLLEVEDIETLADRLSACSVGLGDQPELQTDLRAAARLLQYLTQSGTIYFPILLDRHAARDREGRSEIQRPLFTAGKG